MADSNNPQLPPCDHKPQKYEGPSKEEVLKMRTEYMNPAIFKIYKTPLMVVEGKMQYLYDETGRRYLDCFAGIVTVGCGHSHPKIIDAAIKQINLIQHTTTIYLNPKVAEYSKALAAKMPGDLKVCYFVNSGSEANELALLMARAYTKNYDVIALRNAYHGMSNVAMGLTAHSTWKYNQAQGFGIHHALNPDCYRGPYGYDDPKAADKYAWDVKNLIEHATSGNVAAFIAETIQGVGGTVVFPEGYLQKVYKIVREKGGLCIADEVQTGFARMGTHFWGFESEGVIPDIVTMAKGIGNGFPLAAVVTTPAIAKALAEKIHFNTYGGNPISCAVGEAVLKALEEDKIQEKALKYGKMMKDGLLELQKKYPKYIGDVRGRGLMLGVEMVKSREEKTPNTEATLAVMEKAKELGLLIGKGGYYGNVLRIKPVMCLTDADVAFFLAVMDKAFASLE